MPSARYPDSAFGFIRTQPPNTCSTALPLLASEQAIAELERRFPEGSFTRGVVTHRASFGFFVDIGTPEADGLVRTIDVRDEGPVRKEDYPPIGAESACVWVLLATSRSTARWVRNAWTSGSASSDGCRRPWNRTSLRAQPA